MSTEESLQIVILTIFAVSIGASLFSRRIPGKTALKMVLGWVVIFAAVALIAAYRNNFASMWNQVKSEFSEAESIDKDGNLRIKKRDDGHFWVDAEINGRTLPMMIDTGATVTALSMDAARRVNADIDMDGMDVVSSTANGLSKSKRARLAKLTVGPIVRGDFPVHASDTLGDTNLLGMNFLNTLKGWKVEGDALILNP